MSENKIIEEIPKKKKLKTIEKERRGSSIAGLKSMSSTSNFNQTNSKNDSSMDI